MIQPGAVRVSAVTYSVDFVRQPTVPVDLVAEALLQTMKRACEHSGMTVVDEGSADVRIECELQQVDHGNQALRYCTGVLGATRLDVDIRITDRYGASETLPFRLRQYFSLFGGDDKNLIRYSLEQACYRTADHLANQSKPALRNTREFLGNLAVFGLVVAMFVLGCLGVLLETLRQPGP